MHAHGSSETGSLLRANGLSCALRARLRNLGVMASPDVFITSSPRARRQALTTNISSSPGLPSVREILSQKPHRPPIRSTPSKKNVIACESRPWRAPQDEDATHSNASVAHEAVVEDIDPSFSVTEVPADSLKAGAEARLLKKAGQKRAVETPQPPATPTRSQVDAQPWRKYKSPNRSSEPGVNEMKPAIGNRLSPGNDAPDCSRYFIKPSEAKKTTKNVQDEPLNLEAAMTRRMEWTPPTQRVRILLDSDDTPNVNPSRSSQENNQQAISLETVLAPFRCDDTMQMQAGSEATDEVGFPKKRKLLELVQTNTGTTSKPCKKRKAPKRTRTITEIATAAYKPATQPGTMESQSQAPEGAQVTDTGNGKTKPRKRPSKASKKKEALPKPILLSPEAAMRRVAHQDFLFGTSSQLAREQSPTSKPRPTTSHSAHVDLIDLRTPINSDAIEPAEQRQTLWDAAARDEDGDLFDVELGLLTDAPPELAEAAPEADPFGYVRSDIPVTVSLPSLSDTDEDRDGEPSASLPDMIPAEPDDAMKKKDDSGILYGAVRDRAPADHPNHVSAAESLSAAGKVKEKPQAAKEPEDREGPRYELLTDAQLAKQVAQYGFKPVKKREAMVALLNRCRPETLLNPSGSRSASTKAVVKKRGQGQTKAANVGGKEAQEPASKEKRSRDRGLNISDEELLKMVPTRRRSPARISNAVKEPTKGKKRRQSRNRAGSVSNGEAISPTIEKPGRGRSQKASSVRQSAEPPVQEKRRRSRSRIDSISDDELEMWFMTPTRGERRRGTTVQEQPPPSAQPPFSPRKGKSAASKPAAKRSSRKTAPATPKRRSRSRRKTPEMGDSQSESGSDTSASSSMGFGPSVDETELTLAMSSPTDQQKELFAHINEAVKTAPRTREPTQPSWHEKILMYDPIVLEDLTAWLNSGQLTRVGLDEEVSPVEVKAWCESRSVCCVWRMSNYGKERKRY
ncbi:Structure-specific endonuclease, subunit SLX4 [Ophiocordyceps camponoti-floridani]|uniref:Structure-specific endonuclease subunit SLX4 n=1 Tax=Ophiocordyceps camponoti-floridani TaxID=2030778 RepID=A0A8H4VFE6_9HYPO|nr:Structure-specific endonuclease, subunit SLX4 [Ophiocordyceps camponoti-floridani]